MASQLNPYLAFPGTARDAMTFYESVFGGKLEIMSFGDAGAEGLPADGVMHARLETPNGFVLMASDLPSDMPVEDGNRISVSISGEDAETLRGYWDALSAGGTINMPFERQMWGDDFGACTDRFGIPWMVNVNQTAR